MSKKQQSPTLFNSRRFEVIMHIVSWLFILLFPQFIYAHDNQSGLFLWSRAVYKFSGPIIMAIIFYTNYFWLTPRYAMQKRFGKFIMLNVLIFVFALLATEACSELGYYIRKNIEQDPNVYWFDQYRHTSKYLRRHILFKIRDITTFCIMALIPCIVQMSKKWKEAEMAREQAELERSQAELQSLKNQISPHFLLNTLNNIYALIELNPDKAKTAILDLSRLLQHLLYTHEDQLIPLSREVEVLQHYVELMKIRLSEDVKLEVNIDTSKGSQMSIAPLIFISLVENAFKHGLSASEACYIRISLKADESDGVIELDILNSNHPKTSQDKSGHGIGLEQVQRRLDILYKDSYEWERGIDSTGTFYHSLLRLHTKNMI